MSYLTSKVNPAYCADCQYRDRLGSRWICWLKYEQSDPCPQLAVADEDWDAFVSVMNKFRKAGEEQ